MIQIETAIVQPHIETAVRLKRVTPSMSTKKYQRRRQIWRNGASLSPQNHRDLDNLFEIREQRLICNPTSLANALNSPTLSVDRERIEQEAWNAHIAGDCQCAFGDTLSNAPVLYRLAIRKPDAFAQDQTL